MIVGSKATPTANQWGIITTKEMVWNTAKSKWPSVGLQQLLGPVGNQEVEIVARIRHYLRQVPRTKISVADASLSFNSFKLPPIEEWDTCFNIDPEGCKDVDDILAWRLHNGILEFAIGIALVAPAVPTESLIDERAKALGQTLYREGIAIEPMLPSELSEGSLSLLADGNPRGVLAVVWELHENHVKGPTWRAFSICNRATYTYESVLEASVAAEIPNYLGRIVGDVGTDPHHWIEAAMIAYNHAAAQILVNAGQGILRCHKGMKSEEWTEIANKTACPEVAFLGSTAGLYTTVEENVGHTGLGLDMYCHASSPLRRYADLENQRILLTILQTHESQHRPIPIAQHLNERNKAAKQFERDVWFLSHLSSDHLTTADGFLISSSSTTNTWKYKVYVPTWRRIITVRSDTPEFQQLVPATPLEITAFWDVRQVRTPFVFRMSVR
jgi:hypothetical protein